MEYVFPLKEQQGQYEDFYDYKGKSDINAPWFIEKWAYKTNALSDKTVGQTFINRAEEIGIMSGTPAKNITFSSGVAYEEQQENTQVESNSFTDNYFFEIDLKAGLYLKSNVAAGFGVVADVFAGEGWLAINFGYHYTRTARYEYGTEKRTASSFHLEDNDPSDQFSVTCIKGVNPHHTPYFSLLGGRSSCPLEEGTIARDNPKIYVYDAASNSVAKSQTLYNQDPDGTANFTLQLSNNNPFNEPREVLLYQELSSNTENSEVRVSGQELGSAGIIYLVYPNQPILVDIGVGKGQDYDITNLIIAVRSSCDLPAGFVNIPTEYITLNAHFQSPCSDIALLTPEQEWQIKRRNPFDVNSREQLLLKMIDYDTDNTKLKSARLEYRRIGANQTWQTLSGSSVSRDSLANWNSLNFLPGALNYYPFVWDITNNYAGFPDGNYEVRAVAECETDGQMYSEVIKGSIYRNTTALGLPQPSDKVWTTGDEISVSYIHDVDCPLGSSFVVKNKTTNLPVNGNVICQNNSIYFEPTDNLKLYDGDSLEMSVTNVMDTQGNSMDSVVWTFKVVSADLYSSNDWINVVIEQGDKIDISTFLVNNTAGGEPLSYQIQGLNPYASWLSTDNATGTVLKGMPEEIMFSIDSKTMPIDTVEAMLSVLANGNTYPNLIKLRIRVLAKSPNWQVNTGIYEQTMSLISNFNFDNTGILSQDSADIISVWIDNQPRGVAHISKLSATLYDALISVYGNTADAGKPLSFRVWDASTGTEYDARPDGNATVTFAANTIKGALTNPLLLDVITATDKARYIPLNQGWTMFSINTDTWNKPINAALSSLKYSQAGNAIKTANKSASFSANTWSSANGLDSMNVHRGYQIYLQHADTLRIAGAAAVIKPIALNQGWNLIGYPLQSETAIGTAMTFLGTPDTMWLKTVAQNPTYSANMIANYYGGTWKSAFNSDMQKLRPNFAYWLKVNTSGSQLKYTGVTVAPPVSLLRVANNGANADPDYPETWGVNPANYEQNMLINASISIDRHWVQDTSSLVAAFVGNECRGVGKLSYLPELDKTLISMFVYSNSSTSLTTQDLGEKVEYRIFDASQNRVFRHYAPIAFGQDSILGSFEQTYKFSNIAPDNTFFVAAYPNPFETKFKVNIQSDKAQTYTLRLVDIAGHKLMEQSIEKETAETTVIMNPQALNLSSGVYFLQVIGSLGETTTIKLMK